MGKWAQRLEELNEQLIDQCMRDAAELLHDLRAHGVEVSADGPSGLFAKPQNLLTDAQAFALTSMKPAVLTILLMEKLRGKETQK